jgi:hypothetical protein
VAGELGADRDEALRHGYARFVRAGDTRGDWKRGGGHTPESTQSAPIKAILDPSKQETLDVDQLEKAAKDVLRGLVTVCENQLSYPART